VILKRRDDPKLTAKWSKMGGNRAAYTTIPVPPRKQHVGSSSDVHSVRRGQPTRHGVDNNQEPDDTVQRGGYEPSFHGPGGGALRGSDEYECEEEDDDDDNYEEEAAFERERELLRDREEMRRRFTFQEAVRKRRNLKSDIINAMRRKRRLLMRNENLRFRELYRPPEPGVVLCVIAMVTIVTLILTKSWPFY
jgi:hypothetical protein